jgi:hypothetical protein
MKNEQKFISKQLIPWLKHNMFINMAWEAKYVSAKEKNYNFKSDKSLAKELTNLKIAGRRLVYKISDASGYWTPFDWFCLSEAQGMFFFKFESVKNCFFAISVGNLEKEINSGVKSLSAVRAALIGEIIIY